MLKLKSIVKISNYALAALMVASIYSTNTQAKLLNKIVAIINDKVITENEIDFLKITHNKRAAIASQIYKKDKNSQKDIIERLIRQEIVRIKLKELGFDINDDRVESQINNIQKSQQMNRDQLVTMLKREGIEFSEYFELTKESYEYNAFLSNIISPLVSVSDQEIKNEYLNINKDSKSISLTYSLHAFTLPKTTNTKNINDLLVTYKEKGVLPEHLSDVEFSELENIHEDDLDKSLAKALRVTPEGEFTRVISEGDKKQVFFVKKKSITESQDYLKQKDFIKHKLIMSKIDVVTESWFEAEKKNIFYKITL